ncbi:cell division protein FtsQ/DivIB [Mesorhizobium sp. RP14(2022)]|uniref:Cell division protein FtsQ n=1 Tax=Mesorhizobium liriopis TaxID=2953882 RepID=A0ABT1C7P0_9HYPH|nr:cell division protein FtsQ/DivIB [Mesorhizobium liriopis]
MDEGSRQGFVLPKLLRRPARFAGRLVKGEVNPPRYANAIATSLLIGSSLLYGTIQGGHGPDVVKALTSRSGFAVDQVHVAGNHETSEIDILDQLEFDGWTSLVGFNVDSARERIASLPWIEKASVRKIYPSTVEVNVIEREPFAIWQHGTTLTVVKRSGEQITEYTGRAKAKLPLIVGEGAPEHAAEFVSMVAADFPDIANRVRGYVRIGDRRWNLYLDNNVVVKLPEYDAKDALAKISQMESESGVLGRDILSVDLRLADRVVVQLTPEAADARQKAIEEEDKAARKRKRETRA